MNKESNRDPITEISEGYQASQVLLTANRLGVFERLAKGPMSLDEIAETLQLNRRGARILCDTLVSLSLLEKQGGKYSNSAPAMEYLIPDNPNSRTAILRHRAMLYERWGKLYDAVRTGRPVPEDAIDPRLRGDEEAFALAMADVARGSARETADALDLSNVTSLLDVGGGPGLYAIEFARQNPNLRAVILDNKKTLEVAQANIAKANLTDRVSAQAGDVRTDPLGEEYDFIFISNIIHAYSFEDNRLIITRCANALAPGGRLCVKDFLLEPDRTGPQWISLFAINMLVNTEGGDCYTVDEVKEWFRDAKITFNSAVNVAVQSRIIIGKK